FARHALFGTAPLIIADWSRETRFRTPHRLHARGVCSSLCVVIPGSQQPFGVLTADSTAPRTFADQKIHFLQTVAGVLALAVDRRQINQTLAQQAAERTREM